MDSADVIVIGSGAGGLTAALAASHGGKSVIVIETDELLGGTSALSGGGMWLPGNVREREAGIEDSREGAEAYLHALSDGRIDPSLIGAYLDAAPKVADFYAEHTPMEIYADQERPDYQSTLPGAQAFGRLMGAGLYDTTRLTEEQRACIRIPMWPGGTEPVLWTEMRDYLERGDQWGWVSLADERAAKGIVARGAALVASLVEACWERGIRFDRSTRADRLVVDGRRVIGVVALRDGAEVEYAAADGVVIASGGFEWNDTMWRDHIGVPRDEPLSPPNNVGDGHKIATAVGARTGLMDEVWWFVEAGAQPGAIAVNRAGRRFVNECLNYHDYGAVVTQFNRQTYEYGNYPCYVISDRPQNRNPKYGKDALENDIAAGKVVRADTLRELAGQLGIDADGLEQQVAEFNEHAARGEDPAFHRGEAPYDHYRHYDVELLNDALAPLGSGPYYGERIPVRLFGTKGGVLIDTEARVLDYDDAPIAGLYACGNVTASAFGVAYPGGGGTLGQAVVFGYIAGAVLGGTA